MKQTKNLCPGEGCAVWMGTDNPGEPLLCQLKVKLSKHYLPFLALRTLPDTCHGVKASPGKPQLPDPIQVQSKLLSRSQEPGDPLSCSGLRGVGPRHSRWETVGAADLFDSCLSRAWNRLGNYLFAGTTSVQIGSALKRVRSNLGLTTAFLFVEEG